MQVLADWSPIFKKGRDLMCCHRWILLFGERHAWCLSISFSDHHKVDGQRVPRYWIQGSPAAIWVVCAQLNR